MRERIGKVGRENGDSAAARLERAAFEQFRRGVLARAVAFPGRQPPREEEDAIQRHAPEEQPRRQRRAQLQVVALQTRVVSEYLRRREQKCGQAKRTEPRIRGEQHRREANAIRAKLPAQPTIDLPRRAGLQAYREMPPFRHKPPDLLRHRRRQRLLAREEADDHRLRVLAKEPENSALECRGDFASHGQGTNIAVRGGGAGVRNGRAPQYRTTDPYSRFSVPIPNELQ